MDVHNANGNNIINTTRRILKRNKSSKLSHLAITKLKNKKIVMKFNVKINTRNKN